MTSPGVDVLPHAVVSQKVVPGVQAPLLLAAQLRKAGSDVACNLNPKDISVPVGQSTRFVNPSDLTSVTTVEERKKFLNRYPPEVVVGRLPLAPAAVISAASDDFGITKTLMSHNFNIVLAFPVIATYLPLLPHSTLLLPSFTIREMGTDPHIVLSSNANDSCDVVTDNGSEEGPSTSLT